MLAHSHKDGDVVDLSSILSDSVRVKVQLFPICAFTAALMGGEGRTARATRLVCIEVPFKCSSPVCF